MTSSLEKTDIVFSSNTLEHLRMPKQILENLVKSAEKYAILILPFEDETNIEEHINTFTIDFFPEKIEDHCLAYFKIIDCRMIKNSSWLGKQILVIYSSETEFGPHDLNMSFIYDEYIKTMMDDIYIKNIHNKQMQEEYSQSLEIQRNEYENAIESQKYEYKTLLEKR